MEMYCPICGNGKSKLAAGGISCNECGFEYAFIDRFAGCRSLDLWKGKVEQKKKQLRAEKVSQLSGKDFLVFCKDAVAFLSPEDRSLLIINSDGSTEEKKDVISYSRNERNSAILYGNGMIEVRGDDGYGQLNISSPGQALSVRCAPNCIYVIGKDGKVSISGTVIDESIKEWEGVVDIASGAYHVLGLTKDKRVKIAGDKIEKAVTDKVSGWKNVRAVCAAADCSIALFEDGTLSFAGRPNDPRRGVENWKDIIAVKADGSYAVGLTKDGKIMLAGKTRTSLDMNRSSAAAWENVVSITCGRLGIAALFADGSLKTAGGYSGDEAMLEQKWKENVRITGLTAVP